MAETQILHVAIQYHDKEKANIFFTEILDLSLKKSFTIPPELTESIFDVKENIEILYYDDGKTGFEVFITEKKNKTVFEHICIEVKDKNEFIERCKKHGLKPWFVQKDDKKLLFVKDFSDNLYEVKEKEL